MIYLQLFWEFFKTGLFAIGGGLATLPFLYDISDTTHWFTHGDLANMVAISESTPGPIGVNMATYVGFETAGGLGAVVATLGLITPSIIIVLLVAMILKAFSENKYVKNAFYGLRPASSGLIVAALVAVMKTSLFDVSGYTSSGNILDLFVVKNILFAVLLLILTNCKPLRKLHPAYFLAFSALIGVLFHFTY